MIHRDTLCVFRDTGHWTQYLACLQTRARMGPDLPLRGRRPRWGPKYKWASGSSSSSRVVCNLVMRVGESRSLPGSWLSQRGWRGTRLIPAGLGAGGLCLPPSRPFYLCDVCVKYSDPQQSHFLVVVSTSCLLRTNMARYLSARDQNSRQISAGHPRTHEYSDATPLQAIKI